MSSETTSALEIKKREDTNVSFRSDLRKPEVAFGRCAITGEWGKVVCVDLGNLSIEAPNTEKGVVYDPNTKQVNFTVWNPVVFEQQLSLSRNGLQMLMDFLDNEESPIPAITPDSVYQWTAMHTDGSVISQFFYDENTGEEREQHSGVIRMNDLYELRLLPHGVDHSVLPQYTYVPSSNKFFRNGVEIDVMYDAERPAEAQTVYCRHNTITMGSVLKPGSLSRALQLGHITVLQCIGWCVGGLDALSDPNAKKCLICVDERGNWRPWKYTE